MKKNSVGDRIKEIRKKKGFSAKEVAIKTGIPYSTYSNYENNNREPKLSVIRKIATVLNVSISQITDFNGITQEELQEDFNDADLITTFYKLNETGKKEALKRIAEMTQLKEYKL